MEFFLGTHSSAQVWHKPFWSYIARIPGDIGWSGLAALLLGVGVLAWQLKTFRGADRSRKGYAARDMCLFLAVWVLLVYLVLSISYGKPPWMIYSALPAFALLGGWGLAETCRALSRKHAVAAGALVLVVVILAALGIPRGFKSYEASSDVLYESALRDFAVARSVNRNGAKATVMLQARDLSPIMMFYLHGYDSGSIQLLPADPARSKAAAGKTVLVLDDNTTALEAARQVAAVRPGFVVLRENSDAGGAFASLLEPENINGSLIFNGKQLLDALLPLLNPS